ncbi:MAG: hypothetical protein RTU92_07325, partial [Candidatus Thorarchaeota archaeon]
GMFGKWIYRVIGLAAAGALALVLGSELLTSAVKVVYDLRIGNLLPMVSIVLITVLLLRLAARRNEDSPTTTLMNIVAWAAVTYTLVIVVVATLPMGIIISLMGASATLVTFSAVRDPSKLKVVLMDLDLSSGPNSVDSKLGEILNISNKIPSAMVLVLPSDSLEKVTCVLRARPLLPVCVLKLEETDYVIVKVEDGDTSNVNLVRDVLEQDGIAGLKLASPLHTETVLLLPAIDNGAGFAFDQYCVITNPSAIEQLLSNWPVRGNLHTQKDGLVFVVPKRAAVGLEKEDLPRGQLSRVVMTRDISSIKIGGEDDSNPT